MGVSGSRGMTSEGGISSRRRRRQIMTGKETNVANSTFYHTYVSYPRLNSPLSQNLMETVKTTTSRRYPMPDSNTTTGNDQIVKAQEVFNEKCRAFYWRRRHKAEEMNRRVKEKKKEEEYGERSKLDTMMDKLREEMSSLMDRDVTLMEQMIKMNDNIQEITQQNQLDETLTYSNVNLANSDSNYKAPMNLKNSANFKSAPSLNISLVNSLDLQTSKPMTSPTGSVTSTTSTVTSSLGSVTSSNLTASGSEKDLCRSPEHSVDSGFEDFVDIIEVF